MSNVSAHKMGGRRIYFLRKKFDFLTEQRAFLTEPQGAAGSLSARALGSAGPGHQHHVLGAGPTWTAFRRPRRAADADAPSLLYRVSYLKSRTPTPQASYHTPA